MATKTAALFSEETQSAMDFPASLTVKYQPRRVEDFCGMTKPKQVMRALLKSPRPCSLVFCGPPGSGKTTMGLAFAKQLGGGLIHLASAKLTIDAVNETLGRIQYYPASGWGWVIVADEADRMSNAAQLALLSALDGTASLRPTFGGGMVQGKPVNVIWIFTCNGAGEYGTEYPASFEPRFLSRCLKLQFEAHKLNGDLTNFLSTVWKSETRAPLPNIKEIALNAAGSVRDALQALDLELLTAR
jgi:DNA polymerase III gamma/tau subunit